MAQVAMTVRLDSDVKSQFDSLCQDFGMSANTAFNVFVNAVIRNRCIPFPVESSRALTSQQKALKAIESMRAKAQATGVSEMSLNEINEEMLLAGCAKEEQESSTLLDGEATAVTFTASMDNGTATKTEPGDLWIRC